MLLYILSQDVSEVQGMLQIIIDDKIYEFKARSMGLTCRPIILTHLMKFLSQFFQKQGVQVEIVINNKKYY